MSIARLHHRVLGPEASQSAAPPLVLLHGLMGFAANWGKIWPHFQEQRPVLVLDQRGHGRSEKPETGYSPSDYAGDLAALMGELGWGKCHIVGHSMGGRVALRFVSQHPEFARSLCLEDSGVETNGERVEWIRGLIGGVPTPFADRDTARRFFEENFRDDPMTGSFLHANLEAKGDGQFDWRFHKPGMIETVIKGRATDAAAEFGALTLPTLVIRGGRSTHLSAGEAERMAASRPNVELVEIAGAGHFVHAEKPAEFCRALDEFIRRAEA